MAPQTERTRSIMSNSLSGTKEMQTRVQKRPFPVWEDPSTGSPEPGRGQRIGKQLGPQEIQGRANNPISPNSVSNRQADRRLESAMTTFTRARQKTLSKANKREATTEGSGKTNTKPGTEGRAKRSTAGPRKVGKKAPLPKNGFKNGREGDLKVKTNSTKQGLR